MYYIAGAIFGGIAIFLADAPLELGSMQAQSPPLLGGNYMRTAPRIGFAGLGKMGLAMLSRLAAAQPGVAAWNRSPGPLRQAQQWGAHPTASFAALVDACDTILCAFANARVLDNLLQRDGVHLGVDVAGKTIIQLGTTAPECSAALAAAVTHMGGRYIEAPVRAFGRSE